MDEPEPRVEGVGGQRDGPVSPTAQCPEPGLVATGHIARSDSRRLGRSALEGRQISGAPRGSWAPEHVAL
jgi:hypothetical protein